MIKHNNLTKFCLLLIFTIIITSCEETLIPKEKGYIRHYLPTNEYRVHKKIYNKDTIFSKLSKYAIALPVKSDKDYIIKENIYYPPLNANIHLTYYKLKETDITLLQLVEGARTYVYDHAVKSSGIVETPFTKDDGTFIMMYDIKGNAASNFQFYLTDSTENFIRGSLYFNNRPNSDSLTPYLKYVRKDMDTLVNSFKF